MNILTIGKTRVTYHKHILRGPAPTITDIFDQIYKYLAVVPNPTALYLYQDQRDWLAERRFNKRSTYQGRIEKLHRFLDERHIYIKVIQREL